MADANALVNRVAERLLGSAANMSPALRLNTVAQVNLSPATSQTRVTDAIYFIVTSPDYMLQR
jgi:hypothetical protein